MFFILCATLFLCMAALLYRAPAGSRVYIALYRIQVNRPAIRLESWIPAFTMGWAARGRLEQWNVPPSSPALL